MGNSYSSDEIDNEEHNKNDIEGTDNFPEKSSSSKINTIYSLDAKMKSNSDTSEVSVKLGSFNQPLKVTKIQNKKESIEETTTSCDKTRSSRHSNKLHEIETGSLISLPLSEKSCNK